MSTRGVFILRRDGKEKGLSIGMDAYPSGAGADIVDLIKKTDLRALYDCMTDVDEWENLKGNAESFNDPASFSYQICRMAVKNQKRVWISSDTIREIYNSLLCEYGYVIDLDVDSLQFYVGGQRKPQIGNPYGTTAMEAYEGTEIYYPCRLAAMLSLDYIRRASVESTVSRMEKAEYMRPCNSMSDWHYVNTDELTDEDMIPETYSDRMHAINEMAILLSDELQCICDRLSDYHPVCVNRVRELAGDLLKLHEAVDVLKRRVDAFGDS